MAWFLSNIRYVAWTGLALAVLFLIYFAMHQPHAFAAAQINGWNYDHAASLP
jgi:hypothetical protein